VSIILADTGALVALLDRREKYHAWAVEQTRTMSPPLVTCEAVLAELCFLFSMFPKGYPPCETTSLAGPGPWISP